MSRAEMRRLTGAFVLASVVLWLGIFPLYVVQHPVSVYDGAATARELFRIQNVVFTRILLGLALYVTLMVFAVGFCDLIRRATALAIDLAEPFVEQLPDRLKRLIQRTCQITSVQVPGWLDL